MFITYYLKILSVIIQDILEQVTFFFSFLVFSHVNMWWGGIDRLKGSLPQFEDAVTILPRKVNSTTDGFSWKVAKKSVIVLCEGIAIGPNRSPRPRTGSAT